MLEEKYIFIGNRPSQVNITRRQAYAWLILIVGAISTFYFATVMYLSSFDWGLFVPLSVSLCLVIYGGMKVRHPEAEILKKYQGIKEAANISAALFILSFIMIESLIIYAAVDEPKNQADYVLVLGAGIRGEEVPPLLGKRLEQARIYLAAHPDCKVILSGGQGAGETISEAEAMKRYLVKHGIDEPRIIKEDKATSTFENLKNTRTILIKREPDLNCRLIIVSNDFHIFRAKMLARRLGLNAEGLPCRTALIDIPHGYIREYLAVIKSWLIDR